MMNELNRKQVEDVRRVLRPKWYGTRQGCRITAALGSAALAMIWAGAVVCWFLAPSTTASGSGVARASRTCRERVWDWR